MGRPAVTLTALCLCVLPGMQAKAEFTSETNDVTIELIESKVTEKTLEIRYQITNASREDIWLCEQIAWGVSFEVLPGEDGQTLTIRRRFDVPLEILSRPPTGSYVRLGASRTRVESLSMPVPVPLHSVFGDTGRQADREAITAIRLVVEIGFYRDDLPEKILTLLEARGRDGRYVGGGTYRRPSTLLFTLSNESVRDREERVVLTYGEVYERELPKAEALRLALEEQVIPYRRYRQGPDTISPPDSTGCTRVEIRCQPSVLRFLYPYAAERALLSSAEKNRLESQKTIVVTDRARIAAVCGDVRRRSYPWIVAVSPLADVLFYDGNPPPVFSTIYSGGLPTLRLVAPQFQPFEWRVQCARNLKNLWYRMRLYRFGEETSLMPLKARNAMVYPPAAQWAEAMVQSWAIMGDQDATLRPFRCPSAAEGKCHYAMNPHCEPNSPGDVVLLFETQAGWNQHGGAELFSFDNHDPKGGCVLLNDGTVKFIRTKEELAQLRWKP